ncbi:MAG: hypothetical protein ACQEVA_05475 [Myxococcota bacterium]
MRACRIVARYAGTLAASALACAVLGGCCFPVDRQIVRSPEVDVDVVDGESGKPVSGARVRLCRVRIGPPPEAVVDRWQATTDADGRASFDYLEGTEKTMPLMPHGVAQRGWELCVDHDKYGAGRPGDGEYLLVESGPADQTPHRVPRQTIELSSPDDSPVVCPCDALPDETDRGPRSERAR